MSLLESVQDFLDSLSIKEKKMVLEWADSWAANEMAGYLDGELVLLKKMQKINRCDVCKCFIAKPEGDEFNVCEECFGDNFEDGTEHG